MVQCFKTLAAQVRRPYFGSPYPCDPSMPITPELRAGRKKNVGSLLFASLARQEKHEIFV